MAFADTNVTARITDPGVAALLAPTAPAFESFRVLVTKIKALGEERPMGCFGLVGATPDEGTSAVTIGLAAALSQEAEGPVLLVEAALRPPTIDRTLGLPVQPGLTEWLASREEGRVPLRRVEPWGFFLLSGGSPAPQSAELLASKRMARLMTAARQSFGFVVIDCPPLDGVADSVVLQDLLDGFLIVVRARHASRGSIQRSLSYLKRNVVQGVVFNDRTENLANWLDRRRARGRA